MRAISCSHTDRAVLERSKDVTRRVGWLFLVEGAKLRVVKKAMGLKKGERQERLAVVRVTRVSKEPLSALLDDPSYGREELIREGVHDHPMVRGSPERFCAWFLTCVAARLRPTLRTPLTRIQWEYLSTDFGFEVALPVLRPPLNARGAVRGSSIWALGSDAAKERWRAGWWDAYDGKPVPVKADAAYHAGRDECLRGRCMRVEPREDRG
jgi:hypothetical protein